jgi:hypothetical protein
MLKRTILTAALAGLLLAGTVSAQTACTAPSPKQFADEGGPHVDQCSALNPSHYPPTSGPHYGEWAKPGAYKAIINSGNWLHAAEHGAVIFLINCRLPGDCLGDFAKLQAIADAYPRDNSCSATDNHRIIISGDSIITTRFAAVAWNWSLLSDCLDSAAFAGFLAAHYNRAPEDICGGGTDFSGTGWCNGPLALRERPKAIPRRADHTWRAALWPNLPQDVRPDGRLLSRPAAP